MPLEFLEVILALNFCETIKGTIYLMLGSNLIVESVTNVGSTKKMLFGNYVLAGSSLFSHFPYYITLIGDTVTFEK